MQLPVSPYKRQKPEPTIALINIVFLMLVFFLVAAQVAPPLNRDIKLVATADLGAQAPPDALVVLPDGLMTYRGASITPAQYWTIKQEESPADLKVIRLVPDRDLSAAKLIEIGNELSRLGAQKIFLVTERGINDGT